MDQPEYMVIQEGETVECSSGKQTPFEPSARVSIGFGGYSTVYKEVIPAGRFRYESQTESNSNSPSTLNQATELTDSTKYPKISLAVARKWFPYTPDFDREFQFLETLNSPPNRCHDRIIKYLAVVVVSPTSSQPLTIGKHSLLFPLADLDLAKYLVTEDFSRFELKDLMRELFHLADALSFLHSGGVKTPAGGQSLIGSHMDLNPKNILVFLTDSGRESEESPVGVPVVGTWKITDFSNATLTLKDEDGHDYDYLSSPPKLVPEVYTAPEIQDAIGFEDNEAKANPACDVWSLGCIIFEILVGYVEGTGFRSWKDKYGNSRCYYEREGEGEGEAVRVESRVWKWLNNADVANESDFVVMCKKLVVDMLRIDPKERLTAEQVRNRLEVLSEY